MSKSIVKVTLIGAHIGGQPTFYPAHITAGGERRGSRLECTVLSNSSRTPGAKPTGIRCVIWSSTDAKIGEGFAESMARLLHVGKEVHIEGADLREYLCRHFNKEGVMSQNADGSPAMKSQHSLVVDNRSMMVANDAAKQVAKEIANYLAIGAGQPASVYGFNARPENWDKPGHADQKVWQEIVAFRKAQVPVLGGKLFGYAKIGTLPEGATALNCGQKNGAADERVADQIGDALPAGAAGDDFPGADAALEAGAGAEGLPEPTMGDDVPF